MRENGRERDLVSVSLCVSLLVVIGEEDRDINVCGEEGEGERWLSGRFSTIHHSHCSHLSASNRWNEQENTIFLSFLLLYSQLDC